MANAKNTKTTNKAKTSQKSETKPKIDPKAFVGKGEVQDGTKTSQKLYNFSQSPEKNIKALELIKKYSGYDRLKTYQDALDSGKSTRIRNNIRSMAQSLSKAVVSSYENKKDNPETFMANCYAFVAFVSGFYHLNDTSVSPQSLSSRKSRESDFLNAPEIIAAEIFETDAKNVWFKHYAEVFETL